MTAVEAGKIVTHKSKPPTTQSEHTMSVMTGIYFGVGMLVVGTAAITAFLAWLARKH